MILILFQGKTREEKLEDRRNDERKEVAGTLSLGFLIPVALAFVFMLYPFYALFHAHISTRAYQDSIDKLKFNPRQEY